MSSNRERRQSSLTVEQKVGSRVSERMYPMRQMLGKDRHGTPITQEVFVDLRSGRDGGEKTVYYPDPTLGWSDSPPNLPSGDPGREAGRLPPSQRYREQYAKIDWKK